MPEAGVFFFILHANDCAILGRDFFDAVIPLGGPHIVRRVAIKSHESHSVALGGVCGDHGALLFVDGPNIRA